ncbi:TPA: Fe-S cluster assembly protein SufB, partial [Candidatus Collierbacteria bacterium]
MSKKTDNSKLIEDKLYPLGHTDDVEYSFTAEKGLTEGLVRKISSLKKEPEWMLEIRLKAYKKYLEMKMPTWGGDLSPIDFDDIRYYIKPKNQEAKTWAEVPEAIKNTFEKIGVPEAERELLAGVKSQYDSEVVYGSLKKALSEKGVIFLSMD